MAKSFFSSDIVIDGEIESKGDIEIDGTVKGKVKAASVSVLNSGRFEGSLACNAVTIDGDLQGTVRANDVSISSSGVVVADIEYTSIATAKGAKVQGQLKVK